MSNQETGGVVICRCEGVTRETIEATIRGSSARSINQVKKLTRAGMGMCQGRTCSHAVEGILFAEAHVPLGKEPLKARPPVRPVPLRWLAAIADQFEKPVKKITAVVLWGSNNPFAGHSQLPSKKG